MAMMMFSRCQMMSKSEKRFIFLTTLMFFSILSLFLQSITILNKISLMQKRLNVLENNKTTIPISLYIYRESDVKTNLDSIKEYFKSNDWTLHVKEVKEKK